MLSAPDEVLALAGLELPEHAENATVETTDSAGYHYAYTVTFDAPADEIAQFAEGMSGAPLKELSTPTAGTPNSRYRDTSIIEIQPDSRMWSGSFSPEAGGYGNLLLLVDGPDLTRAHVGIAAFPS